MSKIAEKTREVKGKEERERYTQLNAEFQRRARSDKKGFLSEQCKEIKENNRMRNTSSLFKKIGDTKGTFPEKAMAPHSSVLAWRISGTGKLDGLPSMGSHRVGHN